jgi:hypothetical protein
MGPDLRRGFVLLASRKKNLVGLVRRSCQPGTLAGILYPNRAVGLPGLLHIFHDHLRRERSALD